METTHFPETKKNYTEEQKTKQTNLLAFKYEKKLPNLR